MAIENATGALAVESEEQIDEDVDDDQDARSVDWQALWEEFGFDSPNACGHEFVSKTQLMAALECTEQSCPAGENIITDAVDDGDLKKLQKVNGDGDLATRGFALVEVDG